jgi:nitrite reductase/ring-hydroxylating ferredoxin subunit
MSEKMEAGVAGDFKDGVMKEIAVNGREILVVRLGDVYYAANARCPHMKARLALGTLDGTVVTCPLHGSKFDLKDGHIVGWVGMSGLVLKAAGAVKMAKQLQVYPVTVEGDKVLVEM